MATIRITVHDEPPAADAERVDKGLGEANELAAPLHEVHPMACFARTPEGELIGGAVGRRWGACAELQQLWVALPERGQGHGKALVRAFEAHAQAQGCRHLYLETFSFQAPGLYLGLGYRVAHEQAGFPHGIVKFLMTRTLAP